MLEFTDPHAATLTSVTPRTENHGDDKVFAISLGLKLAGANTLLDKFSPTLRKALYMPVPDQLDLDSSDHTPLLRSALIEEVKIAQASLEGWTLAVDHGIDESEPIKIGGCKVDKFRCVPHEGGSIDLFFRVGSNDIDATEAGLLCSHLSQQISFTLVAPTKPIEAIDGTTEAFEKDHPDATDMFTQTAEAEVEKASEPTGTRTARGRDKTKAALAAGAH